MNTIYQDSWPRNTLKRKQHGYTDSENHSIEFHNYLPCFQNVTPHSRNVQNKGLLSLIEILTGFKQEIFVAALQTELFPIYTLNHGKALPEV